MSDPQSDAFHKTLRQMHHETMMAFGTVPVQWRAEYEHILQKELDAKNTSAITTFAQAYAPEHAQEFDVWIDTAHSNRVNEYRNGGWNRRPIGWMPQTLNRTARTEMPAGNAPDVTISTVAPNNPSFADIWIDPDNGLRTCIWDDGWIVMPTGWIPGTSLRPEAVEKLEKSENTKKLPPMVAPAPEPVLPLEPLEPLSDEELAALVDDLLESGISYS